MLDKSQSPLRRIRLLGEGAGGRVWLAEDARRPGVRFALKEIESAEPAKLEQLRRESAVLASLSHPNLAEFLGDEIDAATGTARLLQEFVDGDDWLTACTAATPDRVLGWIAEALRALAFVHDFGYVHRDIKPANLRVRREPRRGAQVVLLDFGQALVGTEVTDVADSGTLAYLSPEQLDGATPDRRSDLYALGVAVYESIHGRRPFTWDGDVARFVDRVRSGRRARPALPSGYPPGLNAWLETLLAGDPASRPPGGSEALARLNVACGTRFAIETREGRAARLASGAPPGREAEVARLLGELQRRDGPRLIWIAGGVGMGKSRLLGWLHAMILQDGGVVREGTAPAEQDGRSSMLDAARRQLARLRESGRSPAVLLLDELEAAGWAEVALLEQALCETADSAVRLVAAVRPGEVRHPRVRALLDAADKSPSIVRIDLRPLDEAAIAALIVRVGGGPYIAERICTASEGNPLVAVTLLREEDVSGLQPGLERSVEARLAVLSSDGRRWLTALAVLGARSPAALLAQLAELPPERAVCAAREAVDAELAQSLGEGFTPASRLVAACVLRSLDDVERRQVHLCAARLCEGEGGSPDTERQARLWSAAGESESAIAWAERAAQAARTAGDAGAAATWWRFALCHLSRRDARRAALRNSQAIAHIEAGQGAAAARALATVERLSRDPHERAIAAARRARAFGMVGRFDAGLRTARRALELAGDDVRARGLAREALAVLETRLGRVQEALALALAAAEDLGRVDEPESEGNAWHFAGIAATRAVQLDRAREYLGRARAIARDHALVALEARTLISLAELDGRECRSTNVVEHLRHASRLLSERGLRGQVPSVLAAVATESMRVGQLDGALTASQEAESASLHFGRPSEVWFARLERAGALTQAGRPAEAIALLEESLANAGSTMTPLFRGYTRLTLVEALLEAERPDDARMSALIATTRAEAGAQVKLLAASHVIDLESRARPGCTRTFDAAWTEFRDWLTHSDVTIEIELQVRAHLARAARALHDAETAQALDASRAAVRLLDGQDRPALAAQALGLFAAACEASGLREDAEGALESGRSRLEEAAGRIGDAQVRRDFLDRAVFRTLRRRVARGGEDRLLAIYGMIHALNSESEPESVLESMLDMALQVVRAERGLILLRERDGELAVRLARNLERETVRDAADFSRSVVLEGVSGRSILAVDAEHDAAMRRFESVGLYGIRSVLCVPLRSRGEAIGAVYLDSRGKGRIFTEDDLRFLDAFADHAALALRNAQVRHDLERENRRLQAAAETRVEFANIVGRCAPMQRVFDLIEKAAETALPVLILGESGTGKELVARAIHYHGARRKQAFLSENCAAIADSLLESELFGHVRGAFTGAERDRAGLFEQAHQGTLFLDEVGDMSPAMQARLLRVLQEGELRRVGGDRPIRVDVRVVAATHRPLADDVASGRFREDLYWRLNVLTVPLPPLRERVGDVPLLVGHLLQRIGAARGRPAPELSRDVTDVLERYAWPGNVRQLENTLQRLALLAGDGPINMELVSADATLRAVLGDETTAAQPAFSLARSEVEQIRAALDATGGNRVRAAKLLGISRATIFRKIREHDLD